MASKGGVGVELDLDRVPMRETGMTAYELMLSESQERMLMVLKPRHEEAARAIFHKWELDFAVIGRITETGRLVLRKDGTVQADIPVDPLVSEAPLYDRPWEPTPARPRVAAADVPAPTDPLQALKTLLGSPDLCSRRWIWEQYDHMVMADTVRGPGGDAAVVRIHDTTRGLAKTTDYKPRYCLADPETGGRQAVAEAWRNLVAAGATPLALTNNLNFGNPERPRIMGQFVGCVRGMGDAARALDFPVVSGNVSLYNETEGEAILPTPVIGGLGLIEDLSKTPRAAFAAPGETILLIGETEGWLGASLYLREIAGREDGAPPPVDLEAERRNGALVQNLIAAGLVHSCHDLSDGGLLVATAEMALAGGIGAMIDIPDAGPPPHAWLFGEDQGRYLIATADPGAVLQAARKAGVAARAIGRTGGASLTVGSVCTISLAELRAAHEGWLPEYMGSA
jgi:phosphoribosylformylglycinamidine synthase